MSVLLQMTRLRFGTPREMNPIVPQMLTAEVTRNMIIIRLTALRQAGSSISPLKCRVRSRCVRRAVASPIPNSTSEKRMSPVVTPSSLKLAAPQR